MNPQLKSWSYTLTIRPRTVASIVFQISHGYSVTKDDDPLVQLAERATHEFSLASAPGSFFVDLLPARELFAIFKPFSS